MKTSSLYYSPLNAGNLTVNWICKLALERLTTFLPQVAPHVQWIFHQEEAEFEKDHGKVTSLVATKEHVTFSVAWHESKQKLWEKSVKKCSDTFARLRGFFHFSPFLLKPRSLAKVSEHFITQFFFDSSQAWLQGHVLLRNDLWRHIPMILCETNPFLAHRKSRHLGLKIVSLSKANLQIHFQRVGGSASV